MTTVGEQVHGVDRMLTDFTQVVPGVLDAVVVASDGLLVALSPGLDRAGADRFAAVVLGLTGLAHGAAGPLDGGPVSQIVIETGKAFLFVSAMSDGSSLAVTAASDCDVGLVGYEMARLVERAGAILTPALRAELQAALPR